MEPVLRVSFDLSPREAVAAQRRLADRVRREPLPPPRLVAGADVAVGRTGATGRAAVILFALPELEEVERVVVEGPVRFPYVPGLLSFREGPLLVRALRGLRRRPDAVLFDAHGLSHPRRFGLACHLGVLFDVPAVGVAKSRLVGTHGDPGPRRGDEAPLRDGRETIGVVLRTRDRVRPVYVSIGHRVDLRSAVRLVLACHGGTRLPVPTREADRLVSRPATRR